MRGLAPNSRPILRLVADDCGESPETDRMIEQVAGGGLLRGISALGLPEGTVPAFQSLARSSPELRWGAHLYLTGFSAHSHAVRAHHLDRPLDKRRLALLLLSGRLRSEEIEAEFDEQFRALEASGIRPDFLDTHQNIHRFPAVSRAVERLAARRGLSDRIRPTRQLNFDLRPDLRSVLSFLPGWGPPPKPGRRVLVGCPGYRASSVRLTDVRGQWAAFLGRIARRPWLEIVVPVHPGLSPAEISIYSDPGIVEMLSPWLVTAPA